MHEQCCCESLSDILFECGSVSKDTAGCLRSSSQLCDWQKLVREGQCLHGDHWYQAEAGSLWCAASMAVLLT